MFNDVTIMCIFFKLLQRTGKNQEAGARICCYTLLGIALIYSLTQQCSCINKILVTHRTYVLVS